MGREYLASEGVRAEWIRGDGEGEASKHPLGSGALQV